jgi:Zn-finger nucleic acid-binding protein
MKCPVCKIDLKMTERQGVEIDYCGECRGVWLDRGELDKIIERSQQLSAPAYAPTAPQQQGYTSPPVSDYRERRDPGYNPEYRDRSRDDDRYYDDDDRREYDQYGRRKKKREGFLSELFDFD